MLKFIAEKVVLTKGQMVALCKVMDALYYGELPFIPSRFDWVDELIKENQQLADYHATGFDCYSSDWREFLGTTCRSHTIYRFGWLTKLSRGKALFLEYQQLVRTAVIGWTKNTLYGQPELVIPTVEEIREYICFGCSYDEVDDPGRMCMACETGCDFIPEYDEQDSCCGGVGCHICDDNIRGFDLH